MTEVRIEEHPSFTVVGRKVWITGQDNEQFGVFWQEAQDNGLVDTLRTRTHGKTGNITGANVFGVSCVEKDPSNRAFYFFIAAEKMDVDAVDDLECYVVPACKWAIFSNHGTLPMSLIDAEMYAFMEWLPSSSYQHALAPELEVYPAHDDTLVEFWLPISESLENKET